MKIVIAMFALCCVGADAGAQALPNALPRPLLEYAAGLKEVRIRSEPALPQWLAKCDPPFYEAFAVRTGDGANATIAVFIGGSAREEVISYTLIPAQVKSCAAIARPGSRASYTLRRPMPLPKGEYSEIFPILNAGNEVVYLLHEEKSLSKSENNASVTRTLLALTGKSLTQVARVTKANADAAQSVDTLVPFAALMQ